MSAPQHSTFVYVAAHFDVFRPSLLRVSDYRGLLGILDRSLRLHPVRLIAYCALPSHWELIVGPTRTATGQTLAQWVIDTHTFERQRGRLGDARLLYAQPPIVEPLSSPDRLVAVCRSIERRAVQAGLARRAEDWPWSSLSERFRLLRRLPLVSSPFLTSNWWVSHVNQPALDEPAAGLTPLAPAVDHPAELPGRLARLPQRAHKRLRLGLARDQNQTNAHVERAEHLLIRHTARRLQPSKERGNSPTVAIK
jgi:hypothetical protein